MEKKSDYSLCVICCYSFHSSENQGGQEPKIIKNFFRQIRNLESESCGKDNDVGEDVSVCEECLAALATAVEWRENVEEIESQVRSLQVKVLRLMKDLQECLGSYLSEMKVIEEKIQSSDVACLKMEAEKNRWGGGHGSPVLDIFGLRDAVFTVVKELSSFENQLSVAVNPVTRHSTDSATMPPVKIEVEDSVAAEDDLESNSLPSPEGPELDQEVDAKVEILPSDLDKPRRPRRSAAKRTLSARKGQCKRPRLKQGVNDDMEKVGRPTWYKTYRVRYKTKGYGGKRKFLCETCPGFSVKSPHHLEHHLREHELALNDNPKIFTCPHCSLSFALKQLCEFHVTCHRRVFKFSCDHCKKEFAPLELEAHFKEIHGVTKIFQCDNCIYCCSKRDTYLEHLRVMHTGANVIMACDLCPQRFNSRMDHLEHLHQVHNAIDKLVCGIDGCDTTYFDSWYMKQHQVLHTSPFSCLHCDYKCSNANALEVHKVKHRTDRPWKCSRCSLTFKSEVALNRHQKTHDTDIQFQCHLCEKSYKTKRSLEAHLKLHQGEGHTCDQCGFTCGFKSKLKRHMESHVEAERTFFCDLCGKGFKWERQLKKHVRDTHLNTEKYPCPDCDKSFSTNWNLKQHSTVHSGKRPFVCDACGKGFGHSGTLHHHKRLVHGGKMKSA